MIAISLSPNIEKDDVFLALKTLFKPWTWIKGEEIQKVEEWFKEYFKAQEIVSFNSGRSALFTILKSLKLKKDDEILLQAFTCIAVPNTILWLDAKPVFVDIDKSFNISVSDLKKKITDKTKAVIVQHTFGIPAEIDKIKQIAKEYNLVLIEDCAHSLGSFYKKQKIGSFGDYSFFSFGRDKIISSVFGGMAIINKKEKGKKQKHVLKIKNYQENLEFPSRLWTLQQIFHPIAFSFILPIYNFFSLGKIFIFVFQKLKFISLPISKKELIGEKPDIFPKKLPNALSILALNQLTKLNKFNKKRIKIAQKYGKIKAGAIYLRYPVLKTNADKIYQKLKKQGILLGRWYSNVIDPIGIDFKKIGYEKKSCPIAEKIAKKILNLPTYPRMKKKDIQKLVKILDKI